MTKAKLNAVYRDWNRVIASEHYGRAEEIFQELQDLAYEAGGKRYVNIQMNLKAALKTEKADRALSLYDEYMKIEGAWNSLMDFALRTNNFEI